MEYTIDNYFKLLKHSNELRRNKKSLYNEEPELFSELLNFSANIETNFSYVERKEYIEIAKDFLDDKMTSEDFCYAFQAIYEGVCKAILKMEREESKELIDLLTPDRSDLGQLLAYVAGTCESYSPDPEVNYFNIDEKELKECARKLLLELGKE